MAFLKGESFINFMMIMVCAPVVMSWCALAFMLILQAFGNDEVVANIEAYKSVLLIVGSPALVIIYKTLELWTAQQNSQIEQVRKGTIQYGEDQPQDPKKNVILTPLQIIKNSINAKFPTYDDITYMLGLLFILLIVPTLFSGSLTILECSASACKTDCLIHQPA